jgi:AAA-like domain
MSDQTQFFVAGAVLQADTPSYVIRPADQELLGRVLEGGFCYVLTARQMGKSSLMVRAAAALHTRGFKTAQVALARIEAKPVDINHWYLDLLTHLKDQLGFTTDVLAWWQAHSGLGAPQRFIDFLHDVILTEVPGKIALFIDEIDATLDLDFRDDFFAAIRAMYNLRASQPVYNRLTFVLLGVATPTDLITDLKRTPFNIGRRIELREFTPSEAQRLRKGLEDAHPQQADAILGRILHWTNGHPYLTQKLCLAAAQARVPIWDNAEVDKLIERSFFSADGSHDPNLAFVHDRILNTPADERQKMLAIYSRVYRGEEIADDESSPIQNHLELYGLVRVEKGRLQVRNEIYRRIFDEKWIKAHSRRALSPALLGLIGVVIAGVIGLGIYAAYPSQPVTSGTSTALAVQPTTAVPATEAPTEVPPTEVPPTEVPPTEVPPTEVPPTEVPPTEVLALCQVDQEVFIRRGPSRAYDPPIGSLLAQTSFTPAVRSPADLGIWVQVNVPGTAQRGWVFIRPGFISCNFDPSTLPVSESFPPLPTVVPPTEAATAVPAPTAVVPTQTLTATP